jgi:hypothetical protein
MNTSDFVLWHVIIHDYLSLCLVSCDLVHCFIRVCDSNRKLLTGVVTVGAFVQGVFFAEYNIEGMEGKDHVFTQIRSDARQWIDTNIYGYNKDGSKNNKDQKNDRSDTQTSFSTTSDTSSGSSKG